MPLAIIKLRSDQNSPLTQAELDNNFRELDTKKVVKSVGAVIPIGTTGQRGNTNITVGAIRVNTTSGTIEGYYNDGWRTFGVTGYTGSAAIGYNGSVGVTGYDGSIGSVGFRGSRGTTGYKGSIGVKGAPGDEGNEGDIGPRGPTGATGATGPIGPIGSIGPTTPIPSNAALCQKVISGTNVTINTGSSSSANCYISGNGNIISNCSGDINLSIHRGDYVATTTPSNDRAYIQYKGADGTTRVVLYAGMRKETKNNITAQVHGWAPLSGGIMRYQNSSDYRVKTNIIEENNLLDKLRKIRICNFNYKNCSNTEIGFIAHELQEYFPKSVTGYKDEIDENGKEIFQRIDGTSMIPILISAIKELHNKIIEIKNDYNI